jgi:signal transduction histidine kinase
MRSQNPFDRSIIAGLIVLPLVLFLVLRLNPAIDGSLRLPVFHFYIVTMTSIVALIVASFVLTGIGTSGDTASMFTAMAFVMIAGIFVIHGGATPGVIMTENTGAVGISARLSLTSGAIFLVLALTPFKPHAERWLITNRRILWLVILGLYGLYAFLILAYPATFTILQQNQILSMLLTYLTISAFLWGSWRAWHLYQQDERRLPLALSLGMPWLAMAQVSQSFTSTWLLSWWIYHLLMLAAFTIAMIALTMDYEEITRFNLTRYFVALSVLAAVPLATLMGEVAVRMTGNEMARWPIVGFSMLAMMALFLTALLVVRHGAHILDQRADALRREQSWRVDFTNLLVHDLKAPLTSIRGNLELVKMTFGGQAPADQRRFVERAEGASRDMVSMIDNLLDVERIEAGKMVLQPDRLDLTSLLRASIEDIRSSASLSMITLDSSIPEDLVVPHADRAMIRRVLQNLLSNALKYVPENGYLYVKASVSGSNVMVSIVDNGPGIPFSERDVIFAKFRQASGSNRPGAGLGLAFCKLAVEAHGGRIWVEDPPGGNSGSNFVFTLPLVA